MTRMARSYLYVPGDNRRRLMLADERGADAVIADLEDAVAPSAKGTARDHVREWLSAEPLGSRQRWVRINSGQAGLDDLASVYGSGLTGVCIPKVSTAGDVAAVAELLQDLEQAHRAPTTAVAIMPLIETAGGLLALNEISRAPRVQRLQLGEIDLAADLGLEPGPDELELLAARSAVVVASAAHGLLPPLGPVNPDVEDLASLETSTRRLRRLGFFGRAAIHPAQIQVIHTVFDVTPDELEQARQLLERYAVAQREGRGAVLDQHGVMIDEATIRRSRWIVELADDEEQR
jgi:citrate lyase subunit beta/citryl-CoA lyase